MISIDLNQETPGDMQMSGNYEMQGSSGFRFIRGQTPLLVKKQSKPKITL
jgi:hypothetical protein